MSMSHFIENTGDEPLRFLELFKSQRFMDVDGADTARVVESAPQINRDILERLCKDKQPGV
jgi:oxalate decarboxylase